MRCLLFFNRLFFIMSDKLKPYKFKYILKKQNKQVLQLNGYTRNDYNNVGNTDNIKM